MSKVNKRNVFEENFKKSINSVENPIRRSLLISLFWEIVIMIFFIVIMFLNNQKWYINLNSVFGTGIAISLLWLLLRYGFLQETRLKFYNWRNKKTAEKLELNIKTKLSPQEYKKLNTSQSYIGIICLFLINLLGLVITLIIIYA